MNPVRLFNSEVPRFTCCDCVALKLSAIGMFVNACDPSEAAGQVVLVVLAVG